MRPKFLLLGALVAVAAAIGLLGSRPVVPSSEAAPALAPNAVVANASADLVLTDSHQVVPGLSLNLPPGKWKVEVCLLFQGTGAGDEGRSAAFRLVKDPKVPIPVDGAGVTRLYANIFQTTCYVWLVNLGIVPLTQTVQVTARKDTGATGDSRILQGVGNTTSRMIATADP
jgi:hypothetical protein